MMDPAVIQEIVRSSLPGSEVRVEDMTGTGDHFEIEVISTRFEGLSLLERHRVLHRALEGPMQGDIHAVKFRTHTPQEAEKRRSQT